MKKIRNIVSIIVLSITFVGCEKETMIYEGQDAVYFDVQYGSEWGDENFWVHQYYSEIGLINLEGDEHVFSLKVNVAGNIKDHDRYFGIEVVEDSTTAYRGEEFDFTENQVVKAGDRLTRFQFTVKKSERMSTDTVQIQFRLLPSEDFTLPFSEVGRIPGRWPAEPELKFNQNHDPTVHTVYIHNSMVEPEGWKKAGQFGKFTPKKLELMLKLLDGLGITKDDFDNVDFMQSAFRTTIVNTLKDYLMEQYNKGFEHWVLEEDGTMMFVKGVSWAEGTRPEDMVQN